MMVAIITTFALGVAGGGFAQQGGPRDGSGPLVDTSTRVVVAGEVVRLVAGFGQGTPQLVVRDASGAERSFVLGPFHVLQAQGFVAAAGDRVEVSAYACTACPGGYAVIEVKNLSRGVTAVLRNADGTPAWPDQGKRARPKLANAGQGVAAHGVAASPGVGRGGRQGLCGGGGPDLSRTTTFAGTVASFAGGPGEGMPTLVLTVPSGEATVMLAPYRALADAGYTPAEGSRLEVTAAPVVLDGEDHWVALSLKDLATGLEVVFRDPATGRPARGHGPRRS